MKSVYYRDAQFTDNTKNDVLPVSTTFGKTEFDGMEYGEDYFSALTKEEIRQILYNQETNL